jgi:hypothetical protein
VYQTIEYQSILVLEACCAQVCCALCHAAEASALDSSGIRLPPGLYTFCNLLCIVNLSSQKMVFMTLAMCQTAFCCHLSLPSTCNARSVIHAAAKCKSSLSACASSHCSGTMQNPHDGRNSFHWPLPSQAACERRAPRHLVHQRKGRCVPTHPR